MDKDRLDGWKEISNHLNRNVRTAQRWEKEFGLPVYRIDDQVDRPNVYCFTSELDEWFKSKNKSNNKDKIKMLGKKKNIVLSLLVIGACLIAVLYFTIISKNINILSIFEKGINPIDWTIKGKNIVFSDKKDQYLWSVPIDNPNDLEEYYQDKEENISKHWPIAEFSRSRVDFSDVDKDGKNEVIVMLMHENPLERCLAFYDNDGRMKWSKPPEFNQEYKEGRILNDYKITKLGFEDINNDGIDEILVLWTHTRFFPSIFLIYSKDGTEILNYCHTGILNFFRVFNIGGYKKILLGGTNNLLSGDAILVVLESSRLKSGLAPPYDIPDDLIEEREKIRKYIPINYKPSSQKYYIRFKKNEASKAFGMRYIYVFDARGGDNEIYASVNLGLGKISPIHFYFNPDFSLRSIRPGLEFDRDYKDFNSKGLILTPLNDFLKECKTDVLFWDGKGGWTKKQIDF